MPFQTSFIFHEIYSIQGETQVKHKKSGFTAPETDKVELTKQFGEKHAKKGVEFPEP